MHSERGAARTLLAGALYGMLVFLGAAGVGFVIAPVVAHATGRFPIDVEAQAAFSLATLAAAPYLLGLSAIAAFTLPWVSTLSVPRRIGVYAASVLLVWVLGVTAAVGLG